MIIDPNKLTSKHTPGPWLTMNAINEVWCNDYPICSITSGEWGDTYATLEPIGSTLLGQFQAKVDMIPYGYVPNNIAIANVHLISAAPEAIEFIADLLDTMSRPGTINNTYWINKGEEILKKAYNL